MIWVNQKQWSSNLNMLKPGPSVKNSDSRALVPETEACFLSTGLLRSFDVLVRHTANMHRTFPGAEEKESSLIS